MVSIEWEKRLLKQGVVRVLGMDEVGRGALAGPVVAAGVMFGSRIEDVLNAAAQNGIRIDDSKKLTAVQRQVAAEFIYKQAIEVKIAAVEVRVINRLGIGGAIRRAFGRVVQQMGGVEMGLLDGRRVKRVRGLPKERQVGIIKGDGKVFTIAAASIVAKVYRDTLMKELAQYWQMYGWERNVGYGTLEHRQAIAEHGTCQWHRKLFVRKYI